MPRPDPRRNKKGRIPMVKQKGYQLYRRRQKIKVVQCGQVIGQIVRTVHAQQWGSRYYLSESRDAKGNLPIITEYLRKFYCVRSEAGDFSDPNERTSSYLQSLYIELPDPTKCSECGGTFEPEELTGGQWLLCQECGMRR